MNTLLLVFFWLAIEGARRFIPALGAFLQRFGISLGSGVVLFETHRFNAIINRFGADPFLPSSSSRIVKDTDDDDDNGVSVRSCLDVFYVSGVLFFALFQALLSVLLVSGAATSLYRFASSASISEISEAAALKPVVPGYNVPESHLSGLALSLLLVLAVHEVGHALAAATERVRTEGCGVFFAFVVPGAFCRLEGGLLPQLPPRAQLKVYCAGAWHNILLAVAALAVVKCLPLLLCAAYQSQPFEGGAHRGSHHHHHHLGSDPFGHNKRHAAATTTAAAASGVALELSPNSPFAGLLGRPDDSLLALDSTLVRGKLSMAAAVTAIHARAEFATAPASLLYGNEEEEASLNVHNSNANTKASSNEGAQQNQQNQQPPKKVEMGQETSGIREERTQEVVQLQGYCVDASELQLLPRAPSSLPSFFGGSQGGGGVGGNDDLAPRMDDECFALGQQQPSSALLTQQEQSSSSPVGSSSSSSSSSSRGGDSNGSGNSNNGHRHGGEGSSNHFHPSNGDGVSSSSSSSLTAAMSTSTSLSDHGSLTDSHTKVCMRSSLVLKEAQRFAAAAAAATAAAAVGADATGSTGGGGESAEDGEGAGVAVVLTCRSSSDCISNAGSRHHHHDHNHNDNAAACARPVLFSGESFVAVTLGSGKVLGWRGFDPVGELQGALMPFALLRLRRPMAYSAHFVAAKLHAAMSSFWPSSPFPSFSSQQASSSSSPSSSSPSSPSSSSPTASSSSPSSSSFADSVVAWLVRLPSRLSTALLTLSQVSLSIALLNALPVYGLDGHLALVQFVRILLLSRPPPPQPRKSNRRRKPKKQQQKQVKKKRSSGDSPRSPDLLLGSIASSSSSAAANTANDLEGGGGGGNEGSGVQQRHGAATDGTGNGEDNDEDDANDNYDEDEDASKEEFHDWNALHMRQRRLTRLVLGVGSALVALNVALGAISVVGFGSWS